MIWTNEKSSKTSKMAAKASNKFQNHLQSECGESACTVNGPPHLAAEAKCCCLLAVQQTYRVLIFRNK